jgi:membrane protein YqaA with SNARE-associated domain
LPSDDDLLVFSWLTENMTNAGLPALMAIVGQGGITAWFLGQMLKTGGWEVGRDDSPVG